MIIQNTSDIRQFVPVKDGLTFEAVKPFVESAEQKYLVPLIGEEQYELLNNLINNTGSGSGSEDQEEKDTKLLHLCRKAVANLAVWNGFTLMSIQFSDKGAQRVEGEFNKSLYKYQEDEAKEQLKNTGHNALDDVLAFLETNIEYFPTFEQHTTYTKLKSAIIKNTAEFDGIFSINNSRLVFLRLTRYIKICIDLDIMPVIGKVTYDKIIVEVQKPTPSALVAGLLDYLKPVLVHWALSRGIKDIGVNITDKMVYFESQEATQMNSGVKTPVSEMQVNSLSEQMHDIGSKYMVLVKNYLTAHATDLGYTVITNEPFRRDNTGKKTVWM